MALNTTSGAISGTPTAAAAQATYTITAMNVSGSTSFGLVLTVGPAPTARIQVDSLSATSVAPMSTLTITGSGFATTNSIVSIRFIPEDGSSALTFPAESISSTSVAAPTPAFFDPTSNLSVAKTVDVDVIQSVNGTIMVSNAITGLQVSALPAMPAGTTTGALTLDFLETAYGISTTTQSSISSQAELASIEAALVTQNTDLGTIILALNTALQTPGSNATVILKSGAQMILTPVALAASDQIVQAYLANAAGAINSTPAAVVDVQRARTEVRAARAATAAITVPPPPPTSEVGSTNSANLALVTNFWANLSGASPAVSTLEHKLMISLVAEVTCGEFVGDLGDAFNVSAAMSVTFGAAVSLASSEIVDGNAPDRCV